MIHILAMLSAAFLGGSYIKEKLEPERPANTRFDYDAYNADVGRLSFKEIQKKRKRGAYYTTKPAPPKWYEVPIDTVVDVKRYNHDKKTYGEAYAECLRKNGYYTYIRKF